MKIDDFARNKPISEFATITGISVSTLRDWNKRGMADNIGQPGPNGHWLYSNCDAVKVHLATILNGAGLNWKTALLAGSVMGLHLEGRAMQPSEQYYQWGVFAFFGMEPHSKTYWGVGENPDAAIKMARHNCGNFSILGPVAVVIDLAMLAGMLPLGFVPDMTGLDD